VSNAFSSTVSPSAGLFGIFTNRRINTKIMIGFAAVLTLLAVLSVLSYRGFLKVAEGFDAFNQRVKVVGIVRDVDYGFIGYRRFVREFSVSGDETLIAEARKRQEALARSVKQGLDEIKNPERRAGMAEINEQFTQYARHFDRLVALKQEQNNLTKDVLDPLGAKTLAMIEELQNMAVKAGNPNNATLGGEAVKQLLLARLNVNKLLGRHEQSSAQAAENALAALKKAMTAFSAGINDDARKLFADASSNVDKYADAYHKAARDSHDVEVLANGEMAKEAQAIAAAAERIKQSGIADEAQIEHETTGLIVSTEHLIVAISIGSLVLGILLAWLIGRAISKPVTGLCAGMRELADGNFAVVLPGLGRADEVGDMAQAVETFKVKAEQKAHAEAEAKAQQDRLAAQQRKADMMKLADTFEAAVGEIVRTVSSASTELEASATTLTSTAERAQEVTTMVAAASEEASTNVQSVASATEELTSSVNEISRQVQESARIAGDAVDQARKTNDRVAELSKAAARIGDVVELINTIAGQTNLLALNATIEAARAGEAGRGFAVVAGEVKELAQETSRATDDISERIQAIQSDTQGAVEAIGRIREVIERIAGYQTTIAGAVEEQSSTAAEMSRTLDEAAAGSAHIAGNVGGLASSAEAALTQLSRTRGAASELVKVAQDLREVVRPFSCTVPTPDVG
jgi:Methyl-accepting chemotaxis protein